MKRRTLLQWLLAGGAGTVFGYMGLATLSHFLPRPAKKILVKDRELPLAGQVKTRAEFFLVRLADGRLKAFSRKCPHLGCTVNYQPGEGLFICPCHQSRFALHGERLFGPAPRGLYELKWEKSEGGILLEIPG